MFTQHNGVVLDTNIFYSLAQNKLSIGDLKQKHGRLYASPLSGIEVISSSNPNNFNFQQDVVRAILATDEMLPQPVDYLAEAFGFDIFPSNFNFTERAKPFQKFCSMKSYEQAKNLVAFLGNTKNEVCHSAFENVENYKKGLISGYAEMRAQKKMLLPNKEQFKKIKEMLFSKEYLDLFLQPKYRLALIAAEKRDLDQQPSQEQYNLAFERLFYYLKLHAGYVLLSFKRAPEHNDLFDREQLMYLNPKCKFLTHDKLWAQIAQESDLADSVIYLNPENPG